MMSHKAKIPYYSTILDDFIKDKRSMLTAQRLPATYESIGNAREAVDAAYKTTDERQVRLYIIWDNEVGNLPLDDVLDKMRETGAAMVWKVEPIS